MSTLLTVGGIVLAGVLISKLSGGNLGNFAQNIFSGIGNLFSSLSGQNKEEQTAEQTEQSAAQSVSNITVTTAKDRASNPAMENSIETNKSEAVEKALITAEGRDHGIKWGIQSEYQEIKNYDSGLVAKSMSEQGFRMKDGTDATEHLENMWKEAASEVNQEKGGNGFTRTLKGWGTDYQRWFNEVSTRFKQKLGDDQSISYNPEAGNENMTVRNAVKETVVNGTNDSKLTDKENLETIKNAMPDAYIEGKEGKNKATTKAIENAAKETEKDKTVKKAEKSYEKGKISQEEYITTKTNVFQENLKKENVKGIDVGSQTAEEAKAEQTANKDEKTASGSLADTKKVSQKTSEMTATTECTGTKDTIEQVTDVGKEVTNTAKDAATKGGKDTKEADERA